MIHNLIADGQSKAHFKFIFRASFGGFSKLVQDLADLNYEHLQLLPLRADHFGYIDEVVFPPDSIPVFDLKELDAIEVAQRGSVND